MSALYKTTAINDSKIPHESQIEGEWKIKVNSPTEDEPGSNPEQFMAMAWTTCMNATIQALLKARGWTNESRVRVEVELHPQPETKGLYFDLTAFVAVEGMDDEQTAQLADQAHRRCPVSKLMGGYEHARVKTERYA